MFDLEMIRDDFPILSRKVNGKPLVYLDNAATSQKPQVVIDALVDYYRNHNANVHRGIHTLGDESTRMYAEAREKIASFLGAKPNELVLVRNTTEAINLVAFAWARENLKEGDPSTNSGQSVIVVSELEHHSNLVTWQEVAKATGAGVAFVKVNNSGEIDLEDFEYLLEALGEEVKLIALSAVSNTTGAELDIERVIKIKKKYAKSAKILIDGAQSVPQKKTEFDQWGVDFLAFSGHKMYGPMGIGGLLVKEQVFAEMGVFLTGGGMIAAVELTGTEFGDIPDKYDAGTPNVAGAVGLAAACEYLEVLEMDQVEKHARELTEYAVEKLSKISCISLIGPMKRNCKSETLSSKKNLNRKAENSKLGRLGSVAFVYEGVHAHDVAQVLDSEGVAVRSGHHCTQPLHSKFGWVATTRASFGIYNTKADVDKLVEGLEKVKKVFKLT